MGETLSQMAIQGETGERRALSEARRSLGDAIGLVGLLSRRQALEIMCRLDAAPSPQRYSELRRRLNATSVTLSKRLDELEAADLIVRRFYPESPPRVEYALAPKGRSVMMRLRGLAEASAEDAALPLQA